MKPPYTHTPKLFLLLSLCLFACATTDTPVPTVSPAPTQSPAPNATLIPTVRPTESPAAIPSPTVTPAPPTATSAPPTPLPGAPSGLSRTNAYALRKIVSGLDEPVFLTHSGDDSGRLFIVEQIGRIRILQNETLLPDSFLDIVPLVNSRGNEQGLLGLAFSPNYATDGQFYINYTDLNGDTVIARYKVSDDPNRADSNSAEVLMQVDQPYPNHNGGMLAFGPDGYLYIGLGDGGSQGDPSDNGQRLGTRLGKMLRIDVSQGDPYAIPPDNPFINRAGARPEIWANGLRNPWRYSFDRATGDLYIGDVGQNAWEEIDFQPADSRGGENYGWNFLEGSHPYEGTPPEGLVPPIAEYSHLEGGCSVTGGYVYRGPSLPQLNGIYLFADYCSGIIWALFRNASGEWEKVELMNALFTISSFGEDQAGELYLLDHRGGAVYQLVAAP
jgi:glucose/arabinose dehydrogenase